MCSALKVESDVQAKEENLDGMQKHGHTYVQWLFGFLATTTLLTNGLLSGWISPMTKVLQSENSPTGPISDAEMSWVGSSMALTATLGVSVYAYIADAFGRKKGLIAIAVPQALCWFIKFFATNSTTLLIARICGGIPAGGCFNLVPMYLKEISQDHIRGAMVSMTILMNNFGFLVIYALGSYLEYYTVLYIVIVIPAVTAVLMIFAPESPAYLVKMGKYEEAEKTTALLWGRPVDHKAVQAEVQMMNNEEKHYRSLPRLTFMNIFKNPAWRRGFILSMMLFTCQGFNGTYAVMTYAWTILSSGAAVNPELQSLILPMMMIFGSVASMACVESVGRKMLLIFTFALSGVSMLTLATTQLLQAGGLTPPQWLPVTAIAVASWATAAGIAPISYVVMSEMFSFQVRAKLTGCLVTYAWFVASSQLAVFPGMCSAFGIHTMFFIFAGVNITGVLVTTIFPETRGKTIEQIEDALVKK